MHQVFPCCIPRYICSSVQTQVLADELICCYVSLQGCAPNPDGAKAASAIDGEDGVSWSLPLPALNASAFPEPYSRGRH